MPVPEKNRPVQALNLPAPSSPCPKKTDMSKPLTFRHLPRRARVRARARARKKPTYTRAIG